MIQVPADRINLEFVLGNKVMVGTVNANREYFEMGVRDMSQAEAEYPGWLSRLLTDPDIADMKNVVLPKFAGKISVADPRAGSSLTSSGVLLRVYGEPFIRKLWLEQKPVVTKEARQQMDWLASGRYPISFGIPSIAMVEYAARGASVAEFKRIGGPMVWNLIKRAPGRVVAAVLAQPSGSRPEARDLFYDNNMKNWGPQLVAHRPDLTMETVDKFLTRMYRTNPDFVFTVTRDFVRQCQTPVLILPDDIPAHPYAIAMEAAMLAPKAEVSMFPWKEPKERIPLAVRQIRSFLRAHHAATA